MAHSLSNYLGTYRKRAGLSQDEVAFLLGCKTGAKVSRYERAAREPSLKTVLAYEMMFGVPLQELFTGIHRKVERDIAQQSRALMARLSKEPPTPVTARKIELLRKLISTKEA